MSLVRRFSPLIVLCLLVATAGVLFANRDNILDYLALRNYQPAASIRQLATSTTMTPLGERLFFVNRPVLANRDSFNQYCTNDVDQVATLGCYTGDRNGIYLYDVSDPRLNGVEEVTAAHEMLHQVYDRLSTAERTRINGLLESYYQTLTDEIMQGQIDTYKKTEPDQLKNEMHSLFGTQSRNLPADLETYYAQYFKNRSAVVGFYDQYRSEFDLRRKQIAAYDAQLETLKQQIETQKNSLAAKEAQLTRQRAQLDAYLNQDRITEYNAAVPVFNSLVNDYRAEVTETNRVISEFNTVLDARNAIAVQEEELQKALDSKVDPATGQ